MSAPITEASGTCRHGVPNGRDCGCCDLSPDPAPSIADALCTPHWNGELHMTGSTLSLAGEFVDAVHYDALRAAYLALQESQTACGEVVAAARQWKADLSGIVDSAEDLNMDAEKRLWAALANGETK